MWITRFTVSGIGAFPVDMLRYDACHPASQQAVADAFSSLGKRTIELVACHPTRSYEAVTSARWRSFGWTVIKQDRPVKR